jgi:hypothetical protein
MKEQTGKQISREDQHCHHRATEPLLVEEDDDGSDEDEGDGGSDRGYGADGEETEDGDG